MRTWIAGLAIAGLCACSSRPPPTVSYPQGSVSAQPQTSRAAQGPFQPDYYLYACTPNFANRPETDRNGRVLTYDALIVVNGILLATAPVNGACMTSGFGPRYGRPHKGIDLQSKPASTVYSAAPGRILEVSQQTGFGNQVLIDHGNGVYTRYAHLANFTRGLAPGQEIGFGQPLGLMGRTGNATAIHIHYEILTGTYDTPRKSWGLTANNPLDFPRWSGLDGVS
ncbi:MAG: peptidoglycan DD-metalloendopeptidase family protein [Pseudomonadota bacterium]